MTGLLRRVARRLALLPLQALDGDTRAEALERLSSAAVTRAPITGGELAFYAPTPLLRSRAAAC